MAIWRAKLNPIKEGERILWRAYHHLFFPHKSESRETHDLIIDAVYRVREGD